MPRPVDLAVLALATLLVRNAWAAPTEDPEKRAAADALFELGKQAMAQNDFATACPKFEEVVRILPGKIGSLLKLAECYEAAGRVASAKTTYDAAARAAKAADDPRASAAEEHSKSLAGRIPAIVVTVPDQVRALHGLVVRRDDLDVGSPQWGAPIPVDPGPHALTATATGKRTWQSSVNVQAGAGVVTVTVPMLEDEAPSPTPPPAVEQARPAPVVVKPTTRTWPWVIGASGLALLGAAAGFGADGLAAQSRLRQHCGPSFGTQPCAVPPSVYDPTGDNARKNRDLGLFIGFGVAGAGAVAASIVGLVGPSRPSAAPTPVALAWPGGAAFLVRGGFF
jgi:hypothetical protein